MTTATEKRLAEIRERSAELNGMYRSQADSNVDFLLAEIERLAASAAQTKLALEMMSEDFNDAAATVDRLTAERDAAWVDGRDAAAQVADMYAEENIEMAGDSVLTDPCLSGKGFTPENIKTSESRMIDGCIHSSMYHAATNIAAAIRALSPSTLNKPE